MGTRSRNATLVRERFDKGLSVELAAKKIKVSSDLLRRAEKGETRPRPASALKIAAFYGLKPSDIWPIEESNGDPSKEDA